MIHNDVQNQLALLVKTSATPLIEVARSPVETPEWVPGQRLPAHVVASLPNGRFHVLVEDQTLDMNLPRSTQPGDTLDLVFVSNNPRPTFAMLGEVAKSLSPTSQQVDLSPTGKYLGSLIQQQNNTTGSVSLAPRLPILSGAPISIQQFATALKDAISNSGLFYESHQAQWVAGERSLSSLLQEPQGRLSTLQQTSSQQVQSGDTRQLATDKPLPASSGQIAGPASEAAKNMNAALEKDVSSASMPLAASSSATIKDPVNPLTSGIVHQQLDMIDGRQLIWQGQVWPGQEMKWEIEEDGKERGETDAGEKTWQTRLHIDFPVLGGVTATLSFAAVGLKLDFSVAEENTASVLKTEAPSLLQSLELSGLKVSGLNVGHHGGS